MTVIRTYRPESRAITTCRQLGCYSATLGRFCIAHAELDGTRPVHSERLFRDPVLADAWADFMALAGYVVEIEGGV
jgi:hypothetical protein